MAGHSKKEEEEGEKENLIHSLLFCFRIFHLSF
jgi:hypothetical protein